MLTDIKIYRGHQIGGCITVLFDGKTTVVIDMGESLPGTVEESTDFDPGKDKIDAVFFTHYHGDHIGRFMQVPREVPMYMGKATYDILMNIRDTLSPYDEEMKVQAEELKTRDNIHFLTPAMAIQIGDMEVTPFSVDHSAFDAYMFMIRANGETILHTGDYRDHGHRGIVKGKNILLEVIRKYVLEYGKKQVDALITEGTMMTRLAEEPYSERELMRDAEEFFQDNRYIFLKISSTNADSLTSFAKAAARQGMKMYVSSYLMKQIEVYRREGAKYGTTMYGFENVIPFLPQPESCLSEAQRNSSVRQREYMRRDGFVIIASERESFRKVIEEFADLPVKTIYSMWGGYVKPGNPAFDPKLYEFYTKMQAKSMHTSGHAYPELIEKVIDLVNPQQAIYPIHTQAVEEFYHLNIRPELKDRIVTEL